MTIDLEYIEIDGLLYPNIETGIGNLENDLSKYGILRLRYLHEHRRELYRELLMTGKLAEHCRAIDKTTFECSERIQADWLADHPMPLEDTLERIRLRTQAQAIAGEIVLAELISSSSKRKACSPEPSLTHSNRFSTKCFKYPAFSNVTVTIHTPSAVATVTLNLV